MERPFIRFENIHTPFLFLVMFIILAAIGFGGYKFYLLSYDYRKIIIETEQLKTNISNMEAQNVTLKAQLGAEKEVNSSFQNQISSISGTVSTLDKLSKTDTQLLQKYSKVFFLNENYTPANLSDINVQFLYEKTKSTQIYTSVKPFLESMLSQAQAGGVPILVLSAYRSFDVQAGLKSSYKVTYGAGTANSFSADQGYSEHQLGTTVDLTTPELGATFSAFDKSEAYIWLKSHAYEYGFIQSYPLKNTYYQFEPWHWRFVGVALAKTLHSENRNFYDMDQRDINVYLIKLFDI